MYKFVFFLSLFYSVSTDKQKIADATPIPENPPTIKIENLDQFQIWKNINQDPNGTYSRISDLSTEAGVTQKTPDTSDSPKSTSPGPNPSVEQPSGSSEVDTSLSYNLGPTVWISIGAVMTAILFIYVILLTASIIYHRRKMRHLKSAMATMRSCPSDNNQPRSSSLVMEDTAQKEAMVIAFKENEIMERISRRSVLRLPSEIIYDYVYTHRVALGTFGKEQQTH